jgi:2-methylisocitrate lyase-like PEP mutase family enzyme
MGDLLGVRGSQAGRLRQLLDAPGLVVAPGAYDALSARLIELAGFGVIYLTGFGASASLLGRPDVGLLSGAEMVDHARRLVQAVDVPVVADADTGYGNPLNVIRTVREYEQAGVAALHLEDQVSPKRCGHLSGKVLVPAEDMEAKVRAAVAARRDPDLTVIARTDARAVEGLDAALDRARAYAAAGADALFVEAPATEGEVERVASELAGHRLVFNWVEGGRTPPLPLARVAELGFALVILPITLLLAATGAVRRQLAALGDGTSPAAEARPSFDDLVSLLGVDEVSRLEQRFASPPPE